MAPRLCRLGARCLEGGNPWQLMSGRSVARLQASPEKKPREPTMQVLQVRKAAFMPEAPDWGCRKGQPADFRLWMEPTAGCLSPLGRGRGASDHAPR